MEKGLTPPPKLQSSPRQGLLWALLRAWSLVLLCLRLLAGDASAADPVPSEYQVKAAFLYNFAKFVDWPAPSFPDANSPIVIGVVGENPFGNALEQLAQGRRINGRAILVKPIHSAAAAKGTHLLFFTAAEEGRFNGMRDNLGAVLTVGESDSFSRKGGMINFVFEGEKIRFEINAGQAEAMGLKISAQLQKLATKVWRKS
jgi:hypothetical protein